MDCGNCTKCCIFTKIQEFNSEPGEYCRHCIPDVGCNIYNDRPESCCIYECCWKQMEVTAEELRPDRCGMMFEKWSDKVIVGVTDTGISELAMNQINHFREEGISILVINHKEKSKTFLPSLDSRQ